MTGSVVKMATLAAAAACVLAVATPAQAQNAKIVLGMSGWTGFAPLTLADKAGIFKKNGLDVEIKMIPQKDRHLALASKSIQCAATTVETHVAWNANGVPIVQIFQMDKSYGADGIAVRGNINSFADLKGKTIGVDAPGLAPELVDAQRAGQGGRVQHRLGGGHKPALREIEGHQGVARG